MEEKRVDQECLANYLGISQSTFSLKLNNHRSWKITELISLSDYFGLKAENLTTVELLKK